ncbi:putative WD repeat-containing protein on Y chromosome [Apostichopus japonicus]|uniref:Putative WD repeat-containing protein on Y chromosome n=1 Tax=Stichopus japonicus TaxID=307972 RepID=A0A2G8JC46_STIJA|nr:putative WD repeat-containing protein on Y chromosome [Apostichopus japonicus]
MALDEYEIEEKINLEHLFKLKKSFQAPDKDAMMTLDLEEFKRVLRNSLELKMKNDEEITELFMKIDSSSDGEIGWDQFCTYMQLEYEEKEEAYLRMKQVELHTPATILNSPHRETILKITNMSDGTCVTASQDGTVAFWSGGMELKRYKSLMAEQNATRQKPKWVTDLVLMPQYNKIILGTGDREIQFYELSTYEPYCQITSLETTPLKLDYCSTAYDECLLVYGDSQGCINIILIKGAGETLRTWKKMPKTTESSVTLEKVAHSSLTQFLRWKVHDDWVADLRYYDEIRSVMSCSNHENTALVIGCTVGSTHVETQLKEIREMTFQPEVAERKLKITQQNYAVARQRLATDQTVFRIHKGVKSFDYSKEKNMIVTGGMDRLIRIWNPYVPSKPTGMLRGHNAPIFSLFIAADENRVYSLSQDKTIKVWDIKDQVCMLTVRPKAHKIRGDLHSSLYNNMSKVFVIATDLMAMITHKAKANGHAEIVLTHNEAVRVARYNPAFKHIISASDGSVVKLWDYETGNPVFEFTQAHNDSAITTMTFDSSGRRLITGGRDGKLKIWNYNNGHCLKNLEKEEGCDEVTDVTYVEMNKNRYIISVGWDRHINIFSDSGENIHHVQHPMPRWPDDVKKGHKEDILCVTSCPPTLLATSSYDGEIIVWNLVSGHSYCHIKAPEFQDVREDELDEDNSVGKILFIPSRRLIKDSAQLIASGPKGCIHFWKVFDGGELYARFSCSHHFRTDISSLAISSDDTTLFVGDALGFVSVWDIESYCLEEPAEEPPTLIGSWRAHVKTVTSMNLVEEQSVMITSSDDCTVRLWTTEGHYIGTLGQQTPWDIYNSATFLHPMVPYDVLIDPLSLPNHPVLDGRISVHDVIHAESLQDGVGREEEEEDARVDEDVNGNRKNDAPSQNGPSSGFVYNDEMIAQEIKKKPYREGTGKRLRHEKLKKPPKDRGGPNTYQGLKCFDLDDEPAP